jgi:UDP-glucose 4-epimerase
MKGVRCLVLGAGGFLGSALGRALVANGAIVTGYGRSVRFRRALDPELKWIEGSLADQKALAKAVANQEIAFHLVGNSTPDSSNLDPAAECSENVLPTLSLLAMCHAHGVRKVVFCSSGGTVYGASTQSPIPETSSTNPISAYGVSKLMIEKYLALFHHLHGLDFQVLRVANPYGSFQSPFRPQGIVAVMIQRALRRESIEIWGTGDVIRDFIHVDDVAMAFIHAAVYAGPHKIMNVGSGEGRSINQIASEIPAILGFSDIEKVYKAGRPADVPNNVLDISLIGRETGWRPTVSWPEGVKRAAHWTADYFGLAVPQP